MKYKRLTTRSKDGYAHYNCSKKDMKDCELYYNCGECHKSTEVLYRLAEFEDDLESGKIVRFPCKVGDTVYFIIKSGNEFVLLEDTCIGFTIADGEIHIGLENIPVAVNKYYFTRKEAEAKLKELQNK